MIICLNLFFAQSNCDTNKKQRTTTTVMIPRCVSSYRRRYAPHMTDRQTNELACILRVSWTEEMMGNLRPISQAMFIFVRANIAQNDQRFTTVILSYITKNMVCRILRYNYFNETLTCTVWSNLVVASPLVWLWCPREPDFFHHGEIYEVCHLFYHSLYSHKHCK